MSHRMKSLMRRITEALNELLDGRVHGRQSEILVDCVVESSIAS